MELFLSECIAGLPDPNNSQSSFTTLYESIIVVLLGITKTRAVETAEFQNVFNEPVTANYSEIAIVISQGAIHLHPNIGYATHVSSALA